MTRRPGCPTTTSCWWSNFGAQYAQLYRPRRVREGAGLLRDRAAPRAGGRDARAPAEGDHPLRRSLLGLRRGRAEHRRLAVRGRRPGLRDVLRLPAVGLRLGGESRAPAPGSTAAPPSRSPSPARLLADVPAEHTVWMSHGDSVTAAPAGFSVLASTATTPWAAFENSRRRLSPACSGTRRCSTPSTASRCSSIPRRHRRLPPDLDHGQHRRGADRVDPRADRRARPRDLRALRRRRLRRGRRDRAARDRRRLTCVYVDHGLMRQGEDRAGRARTSSPPPASTSRSSTPSSASSTPSPASPTPRRSARSSAASSSASSRPPRPRCWARR